MDKTIAIQAACIPSRLLADWGPTAPWSYLTLCKRLSGLDTKSGARELQGRFLAGIPREERAPDLEAYGRHWRRHHRPKVLSHFHKRVYGTGPWYPQSPPNYYLPVFVTEFCMDYKDHVQMQRHSNCTLLEHLNTTRQCCLRGDELALQ